MQGREFARRRDLSHKQPDKQVKILDVATMQKVDEMQVYVNGADTSKSIVLHA